MLFTLFALWSLPFWILVIAASCALLAFIEYEKPGWATISLIAVFAALYFFGDFNPVSAIIAHPLNSLAAVAGYFVAGTVWSVVKWWFFVRRCREDYDELKSAFLERHGVEGESVPERLRKKWKEELSHHHHYGHRLRYSASDGVIPKAGDHKGRIMLWMCYWPWSCVWTLINDPVKRLFKQIYLQIQGLLQRISNRAFRGVEDDLREPPAQPPAPEAGTPGPASDDDNGAQPVKARRGGYSETVG